MRIEKPFKLIPARPHLSRVSRIQRKTPKGPPPAEPLPSKPDVASPLIRPPSFLRSLQSAFSFYRIFLSFIPIAVFLDNHVVEPVLVRGPSMTPYLNEHYAEMQTSSDLVLLNKFEPAKELRRGMVVTFR